MNDINKLLAKSKANGELTLIEHTKGVINIAYYTLNYFFNKSYAWDTIKMSYDKLEKGIISAAALHDIGKCCNYFQEYIKDPSSKKKKKEFRDGTDDGVEGLKTNEDISHNILSWAFALTNTELNKEQWVLSAILYHHVVHGHLMETCAQHVVDNLTEEEKNRFNSFFEEINTFLKERFNFSIQHDEVDGSESMAKGNMIYKNMKVNDSCTNTRKQLEGNALYIIARSVLIYADRIASSYPEYAENFANNDTELIGQLLDKTLICNNIPDDIFEEWAYDGTTPIYDIDRLKDQNDLMSDIDKYNNNIINASAGFGKTLIGVRWFLRNKKKTLWVTPQNVIATGTYDSIIDELDTMRYGDRVSVGLLLEGEYKYGNENSDIIVTNIDNFLSMMVNNNMAHNLVKELAGNVIFDEYHEFLCEQPLFAAFISYAFTRINCTNSKTLFLSATAIRFDDYFEFKDNVNFMRPNAYNGDMKVRIHIDKYKDINDFKLPEDNKDSFVITHTVKHSQKLYKKVKEQFDDTSLLHANFTDKDRKAIEERLYKTHGKKSPVEQRNAVIGTNALSTGLNISAQSIYDFVINPEGTIQRGCGRGGRFGEKEYKQVDYHVCIFEDNLSSETFIKKTYNKDLFSKWYKMLEIYDGKTITKDKLYDLYDEFYTKNGSSFMNYMFITFNESASHLKDFFPYATRPKNNTDKKILSRNISYRGVGNNIYVTARYTDDDDKVSEPIVIDERRVLDKEKREKEAQKYRYNVFKKNGDSSFKHRFKDYCACQSEDWFRMALSNDTALPLYYARYNSELGLVMEEDL